MKRGTVCWLQGAGCIGRIYGRKRRKGKSGEEEACRNAVEGERGGGKNGNDRAEIGTAKKNW